MTRDPLDPRRAVLDLWRTNARITAFLVERLPDPLWQETVPGYPRRTLRMILAHLHNNRCMWVKHVGARVGVTAPPNVHRHRVSRAALLAALERSGAVMERLFEVGFERGGKLGGFPLDVVAFVGYHVAHEAHHRGQIVMAARQLGQRLPDEVVNGLWFWSQRAREVPEGASP